MAERIQVSVFHWEGELSEECRSYLYSKEELRETAGLENDQIRVVLVIRQLRLGVSAEEGDENVVEFVTECFHDQNLDRTLLLPSLQLGRIEELRLNNLTLTLEDMAALTLVQGKGPVHIEADVRIFKVE